MSFNIEIKKNSKYKRLSLRYVPRQNGFVVNVPWYTSQYDVKRFIQKSNEWMQKISRKAHQETIIDHGSTIPVLGKNYKVVFKKELVSNVQISNSCQSDKSITNLVVTDPLNFHPNVLYTFLEKQLHNHTHKVSKAYANKLGVQFKKITIRNNSSRWGSCSPLGNLSYTWALVFAPLEIIEYLCAHEVSHLKYMDHSPNFWRTVEKLDPHYHKNRKWLKDNGQKLFQYKLSC